MGLARKSVGTFLSKIAIFLFRLAIGVLTARFLGPEGKGFVYLMITSVTMCAMLGNLGLGPASVYFISKDRTRAPTVVGNLLIVTAGVGACAGILGWSVLQYGRPDIYIRAPFWIWILAAVLVPLHLMRSLFMQVLSALLRIKEINIIEVMAIVLHLPLLICFVALFNQGIEGALVATICADIAAVAGFLLIIVIHTGKPEKFDLVLVGASLRFGLKSYLANIMRHLSLRLDTFFVTALAIEGIRAVGIYSISTSIAELLLFVPQSIRLSLFPMVAASGTEEANRLTSQATRHTLFLTTIAGTLIASLAWFVIPLLYGEKFAEAVLPTLILIPGTVMLSVTQVFYGDLTGRGRPEFTTISSLLSLAVTIVLDLLLIPSYGITGAAMAATCAYTIETVVAGYFFMVYSGLAWKDVFVLRKSDLRHYLSTRHIWTGKIAASG